MRRHPRLMSSERLCHTRHHDGNASVVKLSSTRRTDRENRATVPDISNARVTRSWIVPPPRRARAPSPRGVMFLDFQSGRRCKSFPRTARWDCFPGRSITLPMLTSQLFVPCFSYESWRAGCANSKSRAVLRLPQFRKIGSKKEKCPGVWAFGLLGSCSNGVSKDICSCGYVWIGTALCNVRADVL